MKGMKILVRVLSCLRRDLDFICFYISSVAPHISRKTIVDKSHSSAGDTELLICARVRRRKMSETSYG